jgi:hypothetical protein
MAAGRGVLLAVAGVVAGVVVVLVVAAVVAVVGDDDPAVTDGDGVAVELTFPAVDHDVAAAEDLVLAWERWRTATFATTGVWSRTLDSGDEPLRGDVVTVQDPPRRRVVRLGALIEEIDDTVAQCDAPVDDLIVPDCTEVPVGRTYDERVSQEMVLVVAYVSGTARIYDVDRDPDAPAGQDCFRVELLPAALRSPWGRAARFCFDEASGALASSEVRRQSAVDREITSMISTEVTDADFE